MQKYSDKYFLRSIKNHKEFINNNLKVYLKDLEAPKELKDVMLYSVLSGGKRVRPYILAETAKLYNVKSSVYKYPCMAVELAHCFSLIYDDLPCMDNDDLRRGKPTVHIAFSEANALLGGASLLVYAFKILSLKNFKIENKAKIKIINYFSDAIGAEGILSGQYLDLEAEKKDYKLNMKKYMTIQEKKTSLLIAFCTLSGGLLGYASTKDLKNLIDIGLLLGRIFQTQDDIIDLEGTEKEMGKKVNKDQKLNKATIIRLKDISYAKKEVQDLCIDAKKKLDLIKKDTLNLSYLIDFLSYRIN